MAKNTRVDQPRIQPSSCILLDEFMLVSIPIRSREKGRIVNLKLESTEQNRPARFVIYPYTIRDGAQLLFLRISLAIVIREILFLEHTGQVWMMLFSLLLFLVSCTGDLKTVALQKQILQIAN